MWQAHDSTLQISADRCPWHKLEGLVSNEARKYLARNDRNCQVGTLSIRRWPGLVNWQLSSKIELKDSVLHDELREWTVLWTFWALPGTSIDSPAFGRALCCSSLHACIEQRQPLHLAGIKKMPLILQSFREKHCRVSWMISLLWFQQLIRFYCSIPCVCARRFARIRCHQNHRIWCNSCHCWPGCPNPRRSLRIRTSFDCCGIVGSGGLLWNCMLA